MFKIFKNVIENSDFDLRDILKKIEESYIKSDISEEEKTSLESLAREKAKPENSYASFQKQIDELYSELNTLKETVNANAIGMSALKDAIEKLGQQVEIPETPTEDEYPQFVQPNGVHDAYNEKDKITYNGKKYICKMNGCVLSPDEYPAGWKEVKEEQNNKQIASL